MKKSKLSVGLVASFIGALAMSACNSSTSNVSEKEGSLVELVGYSGDKIEIKTDDMYKKYSESSEGTRLYYDAILEALIRYEYPELSKAVGTTLKSYSTLLSEAADKVESSKQTANDNASSNGTSYDEEWQSILDSHDCEDEDDLKQYYLYDLEKEELSDWYAKTNIDDLKDEYLGVKSDWNLVPEEEKTENVDSLFPYHILHVLVSLSADKANYNRGTITEAEATNLWKVVRQLIDGEYSFEQVASLSDDPGSKSNYGDVGIMSTKTSFYNEFKLGIYAYDAILSGMNTNNAKTEAIYKAFGIANDDTIITETTSTAITTKNVVDMIKEEMVDNVKTPVGNFTTIPTVPYDVFKRIGELAKEDKVGGIAPEAGDVALPRNVLYNQFLNFHSPFLITNEDISVADLDNFDDDVVTLTEHDFQSRTPAGNLYIQNDNFIEMNVNGVNKKVLADRNGNVIIGVRSEAGIHFMMMRKSIFEETNKSVAVGTGTKADQSLQNYYTTSVPGDTDYPGGETYVHMKDTEEDLSYYKDRATAIKDELKSTNFDAAYDYRLYEYLVSNMAGKITYSDPQVQENIEAYIQRLRETKSVGDLESINDSWTSYLLMLRYQNEVRSFGNEGDSLLPNTCAFVFNDDAHNAEFEKGGKCYVK